MIKTAQNKSAIEIHVTGIVQGVGFRPFVYKLATSLDLGGWVVNTAAGVTIHVEGTASNVDGFAVQLKEKPPSMASIDTFNAQRVESEGYSSFFIHESVDGGDTNISIPPDIGTCPDCLREYTSSKDRRHGYEFTNCVNCGPRFSIAQAAPYDRANTSMSEFEMCDKCSEEYADPANRRFHAEPNACPSCGPEISIVTADGLPYAGTRDIVDNSAMVIRSLLKEGRILAIKGVGGYHLSCDALNRTVVNELRERKRRQGKPFALMCRDLQTVRELCEFSVDEEKVLTSPARPIVLLKRNRSSENEQSKNGLSISDDIAPGLDTLGLMLPYTPLHYGLFDDDVSVLVMTSANISGDPLILSEEDAFRELSGLADYFVIHNRKIINRADDSVVTIFKGEPYFIRRSRGFVPRSVQLPFDVGEVFAAGGDLKSVFSFARGSRAVSSQYYGDLDNMKNIEAYEQGVRFFREFLNIKPEIVACDLHPNYSSTRFAESYAADLGVPLIKIQHHRAHFASAMVESGLQGTALGVVADGTGYGDDGTVWGFEFFHGNFNDNTDKRVKRIERVGSLEPFMQPRGDSVAKNPLHMAAVLLYRLWGDEERVMSVLPEARSVSAFAKAQADNDRLSIASTSCGRLFDAASALCGFTSLSTYEGEAAMRMESLAAATKAHEADIPFEYKIDNFEDTGMLRLRWSFIEEMAIEKLRGADPSELAYRFHLTISHAICDMLERLAPVYKTENVLISGGTFQNRFLLHDVVGRLSARGMVPYVHRQVPANDGGLALGQLILAGLSRPS